jgi:hypothetical protein
MTRELRLLGQYRKAITYLFLLYSFMGVTKEDYDV